MLQMDEIKPVAQVEQGDESKSNSSKQKKYKF